MGKDRDLELERKIRRLDKDQLKVLDNVVTYRLEKKALKDETFTSHTAIEIMEEVRKLSSVLQKQVLDTMWGLVERRRLLEAERSREAVQ